MAFGKSDKKKDKVEAEGASPQAEAAADDDDIEAAGAILTDEPAEPVDPIAAGLAAEEKAEAAGAGTDALLNMFQTTQAQVEDLSALLDLAGDVELDDLLETLQTVASAFGIVVPGDNEDEDAA